MAAHKFTRSGGKKAPPRRGNEIRTHPLSKEEVARWERAYKKIDNQARKRFALDTVLADLAYNYLVVGIYLSNKAAFKTQKARAARTSLESACSKMLSATRLLSDFIRKASVPTSPRSILRGRKT